MTNVEKATMLAEQVKPCTDDFYSGFYQGALIALNASSNDKNLNEEIRKDFGKRKCEHWINDKCELEYCAYMSNASIICH